MDWDTVETLAYGLLELKPSEFFNLTPREFALMFKGYRAREERRARYVQHLLSPHLKQVPNLSDLTGFLEEETAPNKVSREDKLRELEELKARILKR